jgi:hypothetical protein
MFGHVEIRFYGDLQTLAPDVDRAGEVRVPAERPRSVKAAVESCGVPHTEVDLVLVNGDSVGWDQAVGTGDRVSVYPPFAVLDVPSAVRPAALEPVRFLLDVHLGRLARRLRLLASTPPTARRRRPPRAGAGGRPPLRAVRPGPCADPLRELQRPARVHR